MTNVSFRALADKMLTSVYVNDTVRIRNSLDYETVKSSLARPLFQLSAFKVQIFLHSLMFVEAVF